MIIKELLNLVEEVETFSDLKSGTVLIPPSEAKMQIWSTKSRHSIIWISWHGGKPVAQIYDDQLKKFVQNNQARLTKFAKNVFAQAFIQIANDPHNDNFSNLKFKQNITNDAMAKAVLIRHKTNARNSDKDLEFVRSLGFTIPAEVAAAIGKSSAAVKTDEKRAHLKHKVAHHTAQLKKYQDELKVHEAKGGKES